MIPPESITISDSFFPLNNDEITLKGTLSGLDMDKNSGDIFASVAVGATLFSARIGNTRETPSILCPGTPVVLSYHPDSVIWYEKP